MQAIKPTLGIKVLLGLKNPLVPSLLSPQKKISFQPWLSRFSQPLSTNKKLRLADLPPTQISDYSYELAEDSLTEEIVPAIKPASVEIIDNINNIIENKSNIELSLERTKSADTLDRLSNNTDRPKPKSRAKPKSKSKSRAKTVPLADVETVYSSFEKTSNIQSSQKSSNSKDKHIEEASILVPPIFPNIVGELPALKSSEDSQQTIFESPPVGILNSESLDQGDRTSKMLQVIHKSIVDESSHTSILPIASDISTTHQTIDDRQPDILPDISTVRQTIEAKQPEAIALVLSKYHPSPADITTQPSAVAAVESTTVLPELPLSTLPDSSTIHQTVDTQQPDTLPDSSTIHQIIEAKQPDTIAPVLSKTAESAVVALSRYHSSSPDITTQPSAVAAVESTTVLPESPSTLLSNPTVHQTIDDRQPNTISNSSTVHQTVDTKQPDTIAPVLSRHHPSPADITLQPSAVVAVESTTVVLPQLPLSTLPDNATVHQTEETKQPNRLTDISTTHQTVETKQPDILPDSSIVCQTVDDKQPDKLPDSSIVYQTVDDKQPDTLLDSSTVCQTIEAKQPDAMVAARLRSMVEEHTATGIAPILSETAQSTVVRPKHHSSPADIALQQGAVEGRIDTLNSSAANEFASDRSRSIQKNTPLTELDRDATFNDLSPPQGFAVGGHVVASNTISPQQIAASDTVPAMLTPGEFVINARDSQKNIDLLQHINSGGTVLEDLTTSATQSSQLDRVQDTGLAETSTKVYSSTDTSLQRKNSNSSLTTARNSLVSSSRLNVGKQISVFSPLQFNSLNRQETPLGKGTTQYSSTPLIFRQQASVDNTPEWSSVEDLLSGGGTRSFDNTTVNFAGVETNTMPKGFAAGGEVTASNTVVATPTAASPPQGGIAKIIQQPNIQADTDSPDLEALAREIYNRLRQRLEVERERYGFYSGRLPW